jgi:hypothetical protein
MPRDASSLRAARVRGMRNSFVDPTSNTWSCSYCPSTIAHRAGTRGDIKPSSRILEAGDLETVVRGTVNVKLALWFLAHPGRGPVLSCSPVICAVQRLGSTVHRPRSLDTTCRVP